jgi:hypothetical protein
MDVYTASTIATLCADIIGYIAKYKTVSPIVPRGKEKASILKNGSYSYKAYYWGIISLLYLNKH